MMTNETSKPLEKTLQTPKQLASAGVMSLVVQWRKRKSGELKFYQVGRRIFYAPGHIEDFLKSCEQNAGQN